MFRRPVVKYALVAVILAAAIIAGIAIYSNQPIAVQVASAEENVPVRVFGLGTVEARVRSDIGFEVGATLVELNADHGDRVTKGQVLARLNAGEQEAKLAKARAALLIAGVNTKRAEANREKARAVLEQKQAANRRQQSLVGRDVVSRQAAEEAARDEAVARADVYPRQVVALLGPSGSGKTTLLNVIGCILDPSSGSMELDGEWVLRRDLRRLRLDKIGFIFQFQNLLPFLHATDNVALVLQLVGADMATARQRAGELLDYLEVGHRKTATPAKLSGGEAQRVAIARALANSPRIILADEPTAALDSKRGGLSWIS